MPCGRDDGHSHPERTVHWDPLGACAPPGRCCSRGTRPAEETETPAWRTSASAPRPPRLQWLGGPTQEEQDLVKM